MPLPGFMKCCSKTEETESYSYSVNSNYEMTDSELAEILPTSISRTGSPPKREFVKLPTPKEAKKINQEMVRAMENYRKRIHAQHIHHFLKFSCKKTRRRSTVTQATMTNSADAPETENRSEPLKGTFIGKPTSKPERSLKNQPGSSHKDGVPVESSA